MMDKVLLTLNEFVYPFAACFVCSSILTWQYIKLKERRQFARYVDSEIADIASKTITPAKKRLLKEMALRAYVVLLYVKQYVVTLDSLYPYSCTIDNYYVDSKTQVLVCVFRPIDNEIAKLFPNGIELKADSVFTVIESK